MSTRYGRYRVLRVLGRGASGEVFLAQDSDLGRRVALKVLHRATPEAADEAFERFLREARLYAQLEHPAILPVLAADLEADPPYLVFPYLEGGTLEEEADRGPATPERVARVGERLAAGLQALHDAGVLHRDVKPANVLLDAEGDPYLADLGLGRAAGSATLTETGMVVGTPHYMAPEVMEAGTYSPASDLYALGGTLLHLALGRVPGVPGFLAPAADSVAHRPLRSVLRKLLRAVPEARPASGGELAAALATLQGPAERGAPPAASAAPAQEDDATHTRQHPPAPALAEKAPPAPTGQPAASPGLRSLALRLVVLLAAGEVLGRALFAALG
jgi:serine/threonine protein kinase